MDPSYARSYATLYQGHWWWRAREEAVLELLQRNRPPQGYGRILDVGCGNGLLFPKLSQFGEVEGLEPDTNATSPPGPYADQIHVGPFDATFQPQQRYGLILMLDVLEHLPDPAWAVSKVYSLLKPGGFFLATVPAFQVIWTNHDVLNHHFKRYTRGELRQLLSSEHFQIRSDSYWFHWTFPVKLAQRAAERLFCIKPKSPAIPLQIINNTLWTLCRLEQKTITKLRPPFGSSAVALGVRTAHDGTLEVTGGSATTNGSL